MPTNDLFVPSTTIDPTKDYSQELVGEGKKYSDVASMARSTVEGQLHIMKIEAENAELRQDLSRRASIEEAIERLQKSGTTSNQPNGDNTLTSGNDQSSNTMIKPEDVTKLVNDAIAAKDVERSTQSNVELVRSELMKVWGNEFSTKLEAKANELGVSKEHIMRLAQTQPRVLLAAVIPQAAASQTPPATNNVFSPSSAGINTAGLATKVGSIPTGETYKHWQQVRKDKPQYYNSVEGSKLRHEHAMKHVEAFYS